VIGHQAIGVNPAAKFFFEMDEIVPIRVVVVVPNKNGLSVVTALDDMMRCVWEKPS
jgi:hypothetical protein